MFKFESWYGVGTRSSVTLDTTTLCNKGKEVWRYFVCLSGMGAGMHYSALYIFLSPVK